METKTLLKRFSVFCACFILGYTMLPAQTQYCNTPLTSDENTIELSCYILGTDLYEIIIKSETEMSGLGGTFVHTNDMVSTDLRNSRVFEISPDKKTITINIESTMVPEPHTPLYVMMPGEVKFEWDWSIDWTVECDGGIIPDPDDDEAPTNFTATVGEITYNSVELILKAEDNSGSVVYVIEYDGNSRTTNEVSGVEKSHVVTGLSPKTGYTFSITAKDANDNIAENSPIELKATTLEALTSNCEGTSTEASEGSFEKGFTYLFTTTGNDVTVEFGFLDEQIGVVAFGHTYNPDFAEVEMTNIGDNKFRHTYTGQTPGSIFKIACKFAYAGGGVAITQVIEYTVGEDCKIGSSVSSTDGNNITFYPNPVQDLLYITGSVEGIKLVEFRNIAGQLVKSQHVSNKDSLVNIQELASGNYFITVYLKDNTRFTQKIVKL